jgi:nitrile hydratase accessory protein
VSEVALPVDGPAAPPRDNGELVFAEPWESRAFGLAVSLHDAGAFPWETFQAALIARIAERDPTRPFRYYEHWLGALEDVLAADGTISTDEVRIRAATLNRRAPGHDHAH